MRTFMMNSLMYGIVFVVLCCFVVLVLFLWCCVVFVVVCCFCGAVLFDHGTTNLSSCYMVLLASAGQQQYLQLSHSQQYLKEKEDSNKNTTTRAVMLS